MGVVDLFGREPKAKNQTSERSISTFDVSPAKDNTGKAPIAIFSPSSYSDVEVIINALKSGKPAIVHLTKLKTETAIRVLDMLSGAIYALDGGLYEMEKNVFMFSPSGVEVY